MTKKLLLVLVIVLTVVLAIPSVRADDSVFPVIRVDDSAVIADPDVIISPDCCYPFSQTVVSNPTTEVISTTSGLSTPRDAVAAWEPYADATPSVWDNIVALSHVFPPEADWIWDSYRVVHPIEGDIVYFRKTFTVSGYPTVGTLYITCDNGYEAWLNGVLVGSAQLGAGWEASNRTESFVNSDGWQSVEGWPVSGLLVHGTNTLIVKAANEYAGPLDNGPDGTIDGNPAGLIFQLDVSGSTCPTCVTKNMTVVSGTTAKVISTTSGLSTPRNAVAAWEPYADVTPSVWDNIVALSHVFPPEADWIWDSYRVVHPIEGDIVYFRKTFTVSGYPTVGTLYITCDNGYEAWLNGVLVGSAQLGAGWEASNRTESFVNSDGWQSVEGWPVSGLLVHGTNTLIVKAANEYAGPLDNGPDGTIDGNPAGLIFQLDVSYTTCPPVD